MKSQRNEFCGILGVVRPADEKQALACGIAVYLELGAGDFYGMAGRELAVGGVGLAVVDVFDDWDFLDVGHLFKFHLFSGFPEEVAGQYVDTFVVLLVVPRRVGVTGAPAE